jgi:hypothetical protein
VDTGEILPLGAGFASTCSILSLALASSAVFRACAKATSLVSKKSDG